MPPTDKVSLPAISITVDVGRYSVWTVIDIWLIITNNNFVR